MSRRVKHLYEFGPFALDPAEHTLLRGGRPVPIRPKVFDLLLVLVERHNHLVEKDELMDALWPGQEVEEGNLNKTVSLLRLALGENGNGVRYIETVPKRGYRFAADVREVGGDGDPESVVETHTRANLVVKEETGEQTPTAVTSAQAVDAVVLKPSAAAGSAPLAGRVERRIKRQAAVVAIIIIVLAAIVYLFPPDRSGRAIDSVAVLPFVNAGGGPETEHLADGISDGVISSLSRLPNLRVISLSTVLRYKGKQIDPQAVGRELNVRAVLLGRMTQRADALAVSAELVDVRDNRRLWGGQFNRKPSDILTVQDEIAGEIAEKLRPRLGSTEKQRLTRQYTESTDAYDAYARGRFLLEKRTRQSTEKSIEYFEQAIRLDPNHAPAYAALSHAYWTLGIGGQRPRNEVLPKAKEAVAKALEIDETLPEAHVALGHIKSTDWDWAGAERAFRRAVELSPLSAFAHSNYAFYFIAMRRFDEAVAESKRAVELEPTSVLYNRNVALNLYFARRYDEAIEQCQKTLELDPEMPTAHSWLARSYEQKGQYDQAVEAYLKADGLSIHDPEAEAALREAYAASGWKGFWQKALDLQQWPAKQRNVGPYGFAEIYARLGEKDQAFLWLEKGYEEHNWDVTTLNTGPLWDDLRSDPRYTDLVRRMGLEP